MKEGGGGFISLLYERFMEEWKKKRWCEEIKSIARRCVKVLRLDVFFLKFFFPSFALFSL
jgi:hypothetical protein